MHAYDPTGPIKELEAQLTAMTLERDNYKDMLKEQWACPELAASQAREAQLREFVEGLVEGLEIPFNLHDRIRAMLTLQDNTALRQWGAKLLEEMRENCHYDRDADMLRHKAAELRARK